MIDFGIKAKYQRNRPRNRIGLDIGSYAIKILEISNIGEKPMLTSFGMKVIDNSSKKTLANSIRALADESRIAAKEAGIAVSGSFVIVRFLTMPTMSEEEMRSAIQFEAEKFIPFNIKDCITDFQILNKDAKEKNKADILLVAVKRDLVEDRIRIAEDAGFSVEIVDVDSLAVTNSFLKNLALESVADKTLALLNIGSTFTNLSILRGSVLCFVRDVAIGGNDFNAAIAKKLGVGLDAAEEFKISPKGKSKEVKDCVKVVLDNLLNEVKMSFGYYENQWGRNIDEIYLSGGGAKTIGLDEVFEDTLGSKPHPWNPLEFLNIDEGIDTNLVNSTKDSFAVASGLALR